MAWESGRLSRGYSTPPAASPADPPSPVLAAPTLPANRDIKAPRWNISRPVLVVLEQVFALEKFPSQLMRQRLSADLGVTPRQVNPTTVAVELPRN